MKITDERDAAVKSMNHSLDRVAELGAERDAALVRAERAEAALAAVEALIESSVVPPSARVPVGRYRATSRLPEASQLNHSHVITTPRPTHDP